MPARTVLQLNLHLDSLTPGNNNAQITLNKCRMSSMSSMSSMSGLLCVIECLSGRGDPSGASY